MKYVAFQGGAPATVAVLGGHAPVLLSTVPTMLQHYQAGKLRTLAVTSGVRTEPIASGEFSVTTARLTASRRRSENGGRAMRVRAPLHAVAAAFAFTFALPAAAQTAAPGTYPVKPIRLIVPAAAGGSTDVTARSVATKLAETFGQQIVVDNRVGAGGIIGLEVAARAAPDGYTLLHAADSGIVVSPHLYKMSVDVAKDLVPIAPTTRAALFFIVRAGLPVKTLADFIAYARANPGKLNYGSAGHGTVQHIATEMLMLEGKFQVTHVPYKGSQQVLVDLLAGQVDCTFDLGAAIPHIKSGKVRALGVPGNTRSPIFPDVPTLAEAGANVDITWTSGVYTPTGTPRDIIVRLNREISRIMQLPETRTLVAAMAAEPFAPMTPEVFAAHQQKARDRFGAVVRAANIKLN